MILKKQTVNEIVLSIDSQMVVNNAKNGCSSLNCIITKRLNGRNQ